MYTTELDAAIGYDQAVRHLVAHWAPAHLNFPEGTPHTANGRGTPTAGDSRGSGGPLGGANPMQPLPWEAEDVQVRAAKNRAFVVYCAGGECVVGSAG